MQKIYRQQFQYFSISDKHHISVVTFQSRGQYVRQIYLWSLVQFPVDALFSSKIEENPKKRLKPAVGQICTAVVKTVETVDQKPQNRRFGTPYLQMRHSFEYHLLSSC
ncbi:Hypothetical_protein [Hexamita inflata]|uniref:Hypothetical_protein n=1 Tax=Hexamita inflata TaxID=28002 RepID=A0AA86NKC9_9EUKA|nr:Hypothetical protein HINF_LOCUS8375 [Hexamita inflata]